MMTITNWPASHMLDVDLGGYKVVPEPTYDTLYKIDKRGNLVAACGVTYNISSEPVYTAIGIDIIKSAINKEKEVSNKGLYVVTIVDPERDAIVETTVIARSEIGALMKVWNTEPDLIEVEYDDCDVRVKREMPVREAKSNCERS